MRYRLTITLLALAACGGTAAPTAPADILHVANVTAAEQASCNSASCTLDLRFRLLNQTSAGRAGTVTISGNGGSAASKTATTQADGWGEAKWTFDPGQRPITLAICPQGVTDNTRCGAAQSDY